MTNINKEGLFSSIVPEVYIDSITLETSGNRPFKQDPHIDDHDLETRKVTTTEDKTLSVKIDISVTIDISVKFVKLSHFQLLTFLSIAFDIFINI